MRSKAFQLACSLGFVHALQAIHSRTGFDLAALRLLNYRPMISALGPESKMHQTLTYLVQSWGFDIHDAIASRLLQRLLSIRCHGMIGHLSRLLDLEFVPSSLATEMLTIICRKVSL
jgi:hypothetical protein